MTSRLRNPNASRGRLEDRFSWEDEDLQALDDAEIDPNDLDDDMREEYLDYLRSANLLAAKYNDNHDELGRFATDSGVATRDQQVNTPAFKKWFRKSKVVDENYDPKITNKVGTVYHGTATDFSQFSEDKIGEGGLAVGRGFYFSEDKRIAEHYAAGRQRFADPSKQKPHLVEAYLKVENPFDFEATLGKEEIAKYRDIAIKQYSDLFDVDRFDRVIERKLEVSGVNGTLRGQQVWEAMDGSGTKSEDLKMDTNQLLQKAGHDGIKHLSADVWGSPVNYTYDVSPTNYGICWVAFKPAQIKSAVDNEGTFDPDNPDIRKGIRGGAGSGNFGHSGRPGEIGGSGEGGDAATDEHLAVQLPEYSSMADLAADPVDTNGSTPAQLKTYRKIIVDTVAKMPQGMQKALGHSLLGYNAPGISFYPSAHAMTLALMISDPHLSADFEVLGSFNPDTGHFNLDGNGTTPGEDPGRHAEDKLHGLTPEEHILHTYAHEMSHAIDREGRLGTAYAGVNPDGSFAPIGQFSMFSNGSHDSSYSSTPQWESAFRAEIVGPRPPDPDNWTPPLSYYGATSRHEGWAEFGRLVVTDPKTARAEFPKCWRVWKNFKLVSDADGKGFKYNDNHDNLGRFSSGDGGGGAAVADHPSHSEVGAHPHPIRSRDPAVQPYTKRFKEWFGDWEKDPGNASKIVDSEGKPQDSYSKVVDDFGKPLLVAHGTTHEFTEFDIDKTTPISNMGQGFYFTDSEADADRNYAGVGPDLTYRISMMTERMQQDDLASALQNALPIHARDSFEEHEAKIREILDHEYITNPDAAVDAVRNAYNVLNILPSEYRLHKLIAESQLVGGEGKLLSCFLNIRNPVVIGPDAAKGPDRGDTVFQLEYEYKDSEGRSPGDAGYDEDSAEPIGETGPAADLLQAIREVAERPEYDGIDADKILGDIQNGRHGRAIPSNIPGIYDDQQISATAVHRLISESDGTSDARYKDRYSGVGGQFAADVFKKLGFDGVIYRDADKRFQGMNIPPGTRHFVAWESTQIKSATDNTGAFDPKNPNITKGI